MIRWSKKGLLFQPGYDQPWSKSHAQLPITRLQSADNKEIELFFSTRNASNQANGASLVMGWNQGAWSVSRPLQHCLGIGKTGAFDDMGVMPTCIVSNGGTDYLYYIGWNVGVNIPYHNSIGLAIREVGSTVFTKFSEGPLFDRSLTEPYFSGTCQVLLENGIWRMWYLSCTEWIRIDDKMEPRYLVRYAESKDGIQWQRAGKICINYKSNDEAIAGCSVVKLKEGNGYIMYYSYRKIRDYRENADSAYQIGFAISTDGLIWERVDNLEWLQSNDFKGLDDTMQAYPHVFTLDNQYFMFYNGNGFGQTGVLWAIAQ